MRVVSKKVLIFDLSFFMWPGETFSFLRRCLLHINISSMLLSDSKISSAKMTFLLCSIYQL